MQKRVILPAVALVVTAGLLYGTPSALAFEPGAMKSTLVQKLAQKFGKSEAEVQAVFDEIRTEHAEALLSGFETRLRDAVSTGALTEEQMTLILEKHRELLEQHHLDREAQAALTPEERRAERAAERDELEAWAAEHNIDVRFFGMGMQQMNGSSHRGWRSAAEPSN